MWKFRNTLPYEKIVGAGIVDSLPHSTYSFAGLHMHAHPSTYPYPTLCAVQYFFHSTIAPCRDEISSRRAECV